MSHTKFMLLRAATATVFVAGVFVQALKEIQASGTPVPSDGQLPDLGLGAGMDSCAWSVCHVLGCVLVFGLIQSLEQSPFIRVIKWVMRMIVLAFRLGVALALLYGEFSRQTKIPTAYLDFAPLVSACFATLLMWRKDTEATV